MVSSGLHILVVYDRRLDCTWEVDIQQSTVKDVVVVVVVVVVAVNLKRLNPETKLRLTI